MTAADSHAPPPVSTTPVAAVDTASLTHRYPGSARDALSRVSLRVEAGEIFGVLGPNGGGKTTLFRILATMLPPAGPGSAAVFGHDVARAPARVRARLGVVFQNPSLDGQLTARENLLHQGRLYGLSGRDLRGRVAETLERFDLADRANDYARTFSGGMRRRLEIGKAMLHDPDLLLLDEPSTGLDPGARHDLWRHLERLRATRGVTVLLTTHLMDEADRCDRVAILAAGERVAVGAPAELKATLGGEVITITPRAGVAAADLAARLGEWTPKVTGTVVRIETPDADALTRIRAAAGGDAHAIRIGRPTLEDVFLHLTGHTFWDAA